MLLIPIGHADSTVRRWPVVTYSLIAAFVLGALVAEAAYGRSQREAEARRALWAAQTVIAEHPAVRIPPLVARYLPLPFLAATADWRSGPSSDSPATLALHQVRINALAYDLQQILDALPERQLGFVPAAPRAPAVFTSQLLHFGWIHLFFNALFLFLTAPFVEDRYGRLVFLAFYALCGTAAVCVYALLLPPSPVPLVGSSPALAGVMAAFLVRFGAERISLLFLPVPTIPLSPVKLALPAFVILPLWGAEQFLYFHWAGSGLPAEEAVWPAVLAGFAVGGMAAGALRLAGVERRVDERVDGPGTYDHSASFDLATEARARGDFEEAGREIERALREHPRSVDCWMELYELGLATGNGGEVARAMDRLLELRGPTAEDGLRGRLLADRRWWKMGPLPPAHYLRLAEALEAEGDGRRALELYERTIEEAPQQTVAVRAQVRRGELYMKGGNLRAARDAYERAQRHPACTGPWPALVERALLALPGPPPAADPVAEDADPYVLQPLLPGEPPREKAQQEKTDKSEKKDET